LHLCHFSFKLARQLARIVLDHRISVLHAKLHYFSLNHHQRNQNVSMYVLKISFRLVWSALVRREYLLNRLCLIWGYFITLVCSDPDTLNLSNCVKCQKNGNILSCLSCKLGFFLSGGVCLPCHSSCKDCLNLATYCT
jgi:hypothetical protein